jgi:prepilin-type N-terminal cleavage/methylation domain-containing protein
MKSKKGFTLVELIVVIAVLAVLAAIAIPVVSQLINTAVLNSATSDARTLEEDLKLAKAYVETANKETYGGSAADGSLTIGDVIKKRGIIDACKARNYYSREFVPVWNQDTSSVELMYSDDNTNVQTGAVITDFENITEASTVRIGDLE